MSKNEAKLFESEVIFTKVQSSSLFHFRSLSYIFQNTLFCLKNNYHIKFEVLKLIHPNREISA
jgi:hypothetical protein